MYHVSSPQQSDQFYLKPHIYTRPLTRDQWILRYCAHCKTFYFSPARLMAMDGRGLKIASAGIHCKDSRWEKAVRQLFRDRYETGIFYPARRPFAGGYEAVVLYTVRWPPVGGRETAVY